MVGNQVVTIWLICFVVISKCRFVHVGTKVLYGVLQMAMATGKYWYLSGNKVVS